MSGNPELLSSLDPEVQVLSVGVVAVYEGEKTVLAAAPASSTFIFPAANEGQSGLSHLWEWCCVLWLKLKKRRTDFPSVSIKGSFFFFLKCPSQFG